MALLKQLKDAPAAVKGAVVSTAKTIQDCAWCCSVKYISVRIQSGRGAGRAVALVLIQKTAHAPAKAVDSPK